MIEKRIPAAVLPPCVFILEEMRERGWNELMLSQYMGHHQEAISRLVNGQMEITPDIAADLAGAFGSTPEYWLGLQAQFYEALEAALKEGSK